MEETLDRGTPEYVPSRVSGGPPTSIRKPLPSILYRMTFMRLQADSLYHSLNDQYNAREIDRTRLP